MPRRVTKRKIVQLPTAAWWTGTYVMARRDPDGDYCPENIQWRLARNDHEAQMGLEELYEDEPIWLPMTTKEHAERAALKSQNDRRFYDIRIRMLMRCGQKPVDESADYVRVESTAFPAGWRPITADLAQN